jgi:hypothetical protein
MTTSTRGFLLAGLTLLSAACEGGRPPARQPSEIEVARAVWAETKARCPTYHFTLVQPMPGDVEESTSFEITDDRPTTRMILRLRHRADGTFAIEENWVETAAELGTHETGKAPRTMDQLYDDCRRDVLAQDGEKYTISFSADEQGAIESCYYLPADCAEALCAHGDFVQHFGCGVLDTTPLRP